MSINRWMNILSSQQKWERIKNTKNFWHNLALDVKEVRALWSYFSKFNTYIKCICRRNLHPNCILGKTAWLRKIQD